MWSDRPGHPAAQKTDFVFKSQPGRDVQDQVSRRSYKNVVDGQLIPAWQQPRDKLGGFGIFSQRVDHTGLFDKLTVKPAPAGDIEIARPMITILSSV